MARRLREIFLSQDLASILPREVCREELDARHHVQRFAAGITCPIPSRAVISATCRATCRLSATCSTCSTLKNSPIVPRRELGGVIHDPALCSLDRCVQVDVY